MVDTQLNTKIIEFGFATAKDADEVINLFQEITDEIKTKKTWENYTINSNELEQKNIINQILDTNSKILIARYKDEIIAAANVQILNNIRHGWQRAHIEEFIVKKQYRRHSVGRLLMEFIKEYCKKQNMHVVKLMCGMQLTESQKFYEKMGFKHLDCGYRFEF